MKLHCVAAPSDVLEAHTSNATGALFFVRTRSEQGPCRGVLLNLQRAEKLRDELSRFIATRKRARRSR
jgi:hypothetical protein